MKSRELGPEHSTHSVARYASACGPTNPGHENFFGVRGVAAEVNNFSIFFSNFFQFFFPQYFVQKFFFKNFF